MSTSQQDIKFNLLPDQPLKSETDFENAKFGHQEIADTLTSLIINCPTPFTIGLFGKWGVGKSTVAFMLKKAMKEHEFGFVLFDVWKHESDALRRTFLKESVKQLEDQKITQEEYKLEERIDNKITRKTAGQFQLKDFLHQHWKISIIISLCLILAGILIYDYLGLVNLKSYISIVLSIFTGGGILAGIISKAMSYLLVSETITYEMDRFKDPQEFQNEFKRLLSTLKADKMLVIFDNLDRVTHEKAVETLATIKTFLEIENANDKGVVFLIPCDDKAIKAHLRNVYKLSDNEKDAFSEEEFLKKFFNTTIRIPDFYPTELEAYAMELLSKTEISELKEGSVAWLVTKAYRKNPRQIKQFINQLIGIYILAQKRIEKNSLPSDFLAGNVAKLAKFLILYNEFPNQMEQLRQDKIWDLENVIRMKTSQKDFEGFIKFLNETSHIQINNLNIFFTLRRSDFEVQLSGFDEFATALQDNRIDDVTAYLKALPESSKKKEILSQAIKKMLEETNLPDRKISIINSCLTSLNNLNDRLENAVYVEINNELSTNLKQYLYIIEPSVIFNQLLKPYVQYRSDFAKAYIDLLTQEDDKLKPSVKFVETLFSEIIHNLDWFKDHIDKLSSIITEKYYNQPQVIKVLLLDEQTQKNLKVNGVLSKIILTLSSADLELGQPFDEKLDLLLNVHPDILNNHIVNSVLSKLREILASENTKPFDPTRYEIQKRFTQGITLLLKKHAFSFSTKSDQTIRDSLCQIVLQAVNRIGDWRQRGIYIEPLILLSTIGTLLSTQAIGIVQQFIVNCPSQNLLDAFKGRDNGRWSALLADKNYADYFKQRALKEQTVFDSLYNYLTVIQKTDWLLALLDADPIRGTLKIEVLDKDIPELTIILDKLLEISAKVPISNRTKVYELCDKLRFGDNDKLLQRACEDVKQCVTNIDVSIQQFGFDLFIKIKSFSDEHRRYIVRTVIDWLTSLQVTQIYQPFAMQTVLQFWGTLNEPLIQKKFIEYIFRFLLTMNSIAAINQGMDALVKTTPEYGDFKQYYDDLKFKAEAEENATLKEAFIKGFRKLKIITVREDWRNWINDSNENQQK